MQKRVKIKENFKRSGLGLPRVRKAIDIEMEKQMFAKQMSAGPCSPRDREWTLLSKSFAHHSYSIFFSVISGESSTLGVGFLPKFFQAVREKVKVSS